ncbi:hypothetical protein C7B64_16040 [Merismopedia glauca CCAP 1448/3]|uniref:Uncharacterized protein n=1 Tax=Merismopedia glauca CCAP 1448/3 TaxID=1296344 RepID=A0A2T1C140_9CYAN|nr:hypothetical protein C7B64_16040 [Merismopedia glauca CCAP 1448/3]
MSVTESDRPKPCLQLVSFSQFKNDSVCNPFLVIYTALYILVAFSLTLGSIQALSVLVLRSTKLLFSSVAGSILLAFISII